jgi:hypothetical protein
MNRQDRRQKGGNLRLSHCRVNPNALHNCANPLIFHQKPLTVDGPGSTSPRSYREKH